jgi:16S rRNA (guanine(966)-N(2))-methyltransferase RsmD
MRVIGGSAGGRELKSAPSMATRATSDKVRGAIFDVLAPYMTLRTQVLDLYAGTGALGIEALSRGAAAATFVEHNAACCAVIRANLALCSFAESARVLCMSVAQGLRILENEVSSTECEPYDIIVMDPPYDDPHVSAMLDRLGEGPALRPGGLVIVEHARRRPLGQDHQGLAYRRTKAYGDTAVSIWQGREDGDST